MTWKLLYAALLAFSNISAQPRDGGPAVLGAPTATTLLPVLTDTRKIFLSRLVRRAVRDTVLGRQVETLEYVPRALADLHVEAVIRLRQDGFLLTEASAGPTGVALAVRDAAVIVGQSLQRGEGFAPDRLAGLLLEIEVVGAPEPISPEGDWTSPRTLDPFIEPGVHGLVLAGPTIRHRFCPTEVFTSDMVLADALRAIAEKTHSDPTKLKETRLMRFRTVHWLQPGGDDSIVSLQRGMTPVPPSAVTPGGLDATINSLAEHMVYRQLDSGLFTYQFEPANNRYSDADNLIRQVGASLAMCVHARYSGKSATLAAADRAIHYHLRGLKEFPGVSDAAFIATADDQNKLGVTALLALALAEHPEAQRYATIRDRLVNGMVALQRPSGMFLTAFPPAIEVEAQAYYPGEALLAMAVHYSRKPTAQVLDAFDQAIAFYRDYFRNQPSPAFVPWQVQAYALIARHSQRPDYAAYVFELTDWLAAKQLTQANCEWPDLWGGIAGYEPNRVGVATASYLEGFADALALARSTNDAARAARYESLVRDSARFVMQLQIRPEEAYYIKSPRDAVGGIRTGPALNLLRIDHCQHALIGLIKARQVLFPDAS